MTIEEKIYQNQFKNSYHKLAINLLYTTSQMESFLKAHFKQQDITLQQYNILRILRGSFPKPLSTLQIRDRMMDKMSDTSRIVDRMLLKDLVTKTTNPKDNRLVDVLISTKGLEKLELLNDTEEKITQYLSAVSENDAEILSNLLDRLEL